MEEKIQVPHSGSARSINLHTQKCFGCKWQCLHTDHKRKSHPKFPTMTICRSCLSIYSQLPEHLKEWGNLIFLLSLPMVGLDCWNVDSVNQTLIFWWLWSCWPCHLGHHGIRLHGFESPFPSQKPLPLGFSVLFLQTEWEYMGGCLPGYNIAVYMWKAHRCELYAQGSSDLGVSLLQTRYIEFL